MEKKKKKAILVYTFEVILSFPCTFGSRFVESPVDCTSRNNAVKKVCCSFFNYREFLSLSWVICQYLFCCLLLY